ncbi:hypothetical protein BDV18DRAFT_29639 [Aspergillus unguis]
MSCIVPDCSIEEVELVANPDISGIGVLVGFLATAWATFFILLFHYVAVPFEASSSPLDSSLRRSLQRILRWIPTGTMDKPLRTVVLAMSDQQLVTGIAILVSGFSQIPCGLSLYHWQIITTLTWFSTTTHFATLPFVQQYLRRNKVLLYFRVVLMFTLAIMLAVALIPKADNYPFDSLARPAKCVMDKPDLGFNINGEGVQILLSELILLGALLVRLLRMFPTSRGISAQALQQVRVKGQKLIIWSCERLERCSRSVGLLTAMPLVFALASIISVQAFVDFLRSGAFELFWLFFSLIWGTIRLFAVRMSLPDDNKVLEEDAWGFGQFVPVLLLFIPVLLVAEGWSGTNHYHHSWRISRQLTSKLEIADKEHPHNATAAQSSVDLPLTSLGASTQQSQNNLDQFSWALPHPTTSIVCSSPAGNSINSRIKILCGSNFRDESWYPANLYFTLCCLTSMAPLVLGQALSNMGGNGITVAMWLGPLVIGGWAGLMIIPFHVVLDSLDEQHKPMSKRWPLSIIRILTDQGRWYRIFRGACCLFCIACSATGLVMLLASGDPLGTQIILLYIPPGMCAVVLLFSLIAAHFTVYSKILLHGM